MDTPQAGRRKKSDKAKEKYERNGGYSQKHVRIAATKVEAAAARVAVIAKQKLK